MIEVLGAIAGIGALIYMAFIGQKPLREWWSDFKKEEPKNILPNIPNPNKEDKVAKNNNLCS